MEVEVEKEEVGGSEVLFLRTSANVQLE